MKNKEETGMRAGDGLHASDPDSNVSSTARNRRGFISVVSEFFLFAGVKTLRATVRAIPLSCWSLPARAIASVLWIFMTTYKRRVLNNLGSAGWSPEDARRIGKACFRSNLLVLFESLAMPELLERRGVRIEYRIPPEAQAVLERIRAGKERFALAVSGHLGCWEITGAVLARLSAPVPVAVTIASIKNSSMNDFVARLRKSYGMTSLDNSRFIRFVLTEERKGSPWVYAMLCDMHVGQHLVRVPFMGRNCCTPAVPATLSRKFGCPILLGCCQRNAPGDYVVHVELLDASVYRDLDESEAIRRITAEINRFYERSIARAPEQWIWMYRRWRSCCAMEDDREESRSTGASAVRAAKDRDDATSQGVEKSQA
jgi:KDO2-lipid IV(A) lauroyltransferase